MDYHFLNGILQNTKKKKSLSRCHAKKYCILIFIKEKKHIKNSEFFASFIQDYF